MYRLFTLYTGDMPQVSCKKCNKEFHVKPFWIKKGYGIYCSSTCQYEGRKNGKDLPCDSCGKVTYKKALQIERSKSGKFFCSKACQTKWRNSYFSGERHANWKDGSSQYRSYLEKAGVPQVCRRCHTTDVRVLAVHHIDKNRKNNSLENLAYLCHNCHHLVHHDQEEYKKFMVPIV